MYCDGTQPDGLPQRHKLSSYGGIAPGDANTRVLRGPLDVCDVAQGTMTFTRKIEALDDTENAKLLLQWRRRARRLRRQQLTQWAC